MFMSTIALHSTRGVMQTDNSFAPSKDNAKEFPAELENTLSKESGLVRYVDSESFEILNLEQLRDRVIALIAAEEDAEELAAKLRMATGHDFRHYSDQMWNCQDALFSRDQLPDLLMDELPECRVEMAQAYSDITGEKTSIMAGGYIIILKNAESAS